MGTLKQLRMLRSLTDPLPDMPVLVPGCTLITGDAPGGPAAWEAIITDSFERPHSFDQIRNDATCAPERVFLLMVDGQPAATASVQHPADKPDLGVVHMVGVHSIFLGHRFGRLMVLRALHAIRKSGRVAAELTTDDFRLPAIRTYLGLGFVPVMEDDTMPARWDAVHAKLAAYRKNG